MDSKVQDLIQTVQGQTITNGAGDDSNEKEQKEIFVMRFKEGPVLKSLNFLATSDSAQREMDKYINHIRQRDNVRVVAIGKAERFCVTIDDEIEKWNRKHQPFPNNVFSNGA